MFVSRFLRHLLLGLSLLLALSGAARAAGVVPPLQAPRFDTVGDSNTIPQSVVSALTQDQKGVIWIGTSVGLVRYDGYSYRPQTVALPGGRKRALGFVRSLLVARDGRLWVGTESDGLALVDAHSVEPRLFSHDPADSQSVAPGTLRALAEGSDGAIWVGTIGHGLDRLDPQTGRFSHFRKGVDGLADDRIQSLLVDRSGALWVGSWSGLQRRAPGQSRFESVLPELAGQIITGLYEAADGSLWVGTQRGHLLRVQAAGTEGSPVQALSTQGSAVYSVIQTPAGQVWVARGNGIELREPGGRLLMELHHEPANSAGLASNDVRVLLRDRAGWVWVGSYGGGLQRHDPANNSIWVRQQDLTPGGVFEQASARSLLQLDNGEIWVGTSERGLAVMDGHLRVIGELRPDKQRFPSGRIAALAQTRDGHVWLGCDDGLYELDRQRRVLSVLRAGPGRVRRLLAGTQGELWAATQDGLYRVQAGQARRLGLSGGRALNGDINALALAADGTLWVGAEAGLLRLAPGEQELQPVPLKPEGEVGRGTVVGLLIDSRKQLWVDTALGLYRLTGWDAKGAARFDAISARLGLDGRAFGANLLEDGRGRIWTQLYVYDPGKDHITELSTADGVDFGTGWFRSYAKLADGRLLFGGSKGVLVVAPDGFQPWRYAPPLVASELRVDGHHRGLGQLDEGILLQPGERGFSLEFAALDYSDPSRLRYLYRLQGYDADWIETDASLRVAAYANLPPGRYQLQVRGSNRIGDWSEHELDIPVQVLPAWWQRWWFRTLAGLAALLLLLGVVQLRTHYLSRRQRVLEARVRERTAELEAMSLALKESALSDPLTGLRNRRFLTQHIEADVALTLRRHESAAQHGGPAPADADLLFFLLDIDEFKRVNDEHGHAGGDAVLQQMRSRLEPVFRATDWLVRWGGEEFLIVARGADRRRAAELAERVRRMVGERPFVLDDGSPLTRSCSIGFACFPLSAAHPRALDWQATVELADAALYAAKRSGRNTWVGVLDAGRLDAAVLQRRPAAADLLASGELTVLRNSA